MWGLVGVMWESGWDAGVGVGVAAAAAVARGWGARAAAVAIADVVIGVAERGEPKGPGAIVVLVLGLFLVEVRIAGKERVGVPPLVPGRVCLGSEGAAIPPGQPSLPKPCASSSAAACSVCENGANGVGELDQSQVGVKMSS